MALRRSWRRRWKPDLKAQPWEPFKVESNDYQVKAYFVDSSVDTSYELCISDLDRIWYEKVDETVFNARAKTLNPNVEAKMSYLLRHIQKNVEKQQEDTAYTIKKMLGEEGESTLVFHLKSKLQAGVPFVWEFQCSPGSHEMTRVHLLQPMLAMVSELNRQQTELLTLLKRKDIEIKEYKDLGVRISRKSLGTPEFDETAFSSKMVLSQGFEDAVKKASVNAFSGPLCDLYRQVMIKSSWLQEKDLPLAEEDEDGLLEVPETLLVSDTVPSASSWADRLPPSLLRKDDPPPTTSSLRGSPKKSNVSSPVKVSSPQVSPSKVLELQRREELQKKLAEDAEKKKRKKRKINL